MNPGSPVCDIPEVENMPKIKRENEAPSPFHRCLAENEFFSTKRNEEHLKLRQWNNVQSKLGGSKNGEADVMLSKLSMH